MAVVKGRKRGLEKLWNLQLWRQSKFYLAKAMSNLIKADLALRN